MLPTAAGSILLKKCESKSELEHQKYEKMVQQLGCLMQTGIDGYEIYKNVGVMHAVVFADRAQEAKSAQVMGPLQNCNGLEKRKNSDRNGQKSEKSKSNAKKCSYRGRVGGQKSEIFNQKCLKSFCKIVLPV